ncbi:MAG TPA: hypothetical protein VHW66_21855 [Stellaceae bacterium]|jgi:hypothetical protein|nr:hypothetical protein [Stellaceae bacterium]
MAIFRSREAENIDTVKAKLEAARADLAAQEQYLAEIALETALAEGDTPTATAAQDAVRHLRERVELLEAAVTEATRLEAARAAKAKAEADKSRLRAIRQHDATMVKAAKEFEVASANMAAAWTRLTAARDSHNALLRLGEEQHKVTPLLRPLALAQIAKADHAAGGRHTPGTPAKTEYGHVVPHGQHVSQLVDFSAALEQRLLNTWRTLGGNDQ